LTLADLLYIGPVLYHRNLRWLAGLLASLPICVSASLETPAELTDPSVIMRRAMERSQALQETPAQPPYRYQRFVLTEELDAKGRVVGTKERTALVDAARGDKDEEQSSSQTKALSEKGEKKHRTSREIVLEEELLAKYEFVLRGKEHREGRPTYLLTFQPRPKLPTRQMEDRVLNRLAGKIWIDAAEFEISKLEVWLGEKVTLGWGVIAALYALDFSMERSRTPDGFWLPSGSQGAVRLRQLIDSKSIRWREQVSALTRLSADELHTAR
jgi:hypothetical protein